MVCQVEGIELFKCLVLFAHINIIKQLSYEQIKINALILQVIDLGIQQWVKLYNSLEFDQVDIFPSIIYRNIIKIKEMTYEKYRIPPDFQLARLHARSCRLYTLSNNQAAANEKCGCCNQLIGEKSVSICSSTSSLRRIGQQVPLFLSFNILTVVLVICVIFTKAGQYLLNCGNSCDNYVEYHVTGLWNWDFNIVMGFLHADNDLFMMIEIIIYSLIILFLKFHLKKRKYKYKAFNYAIQKKSIQLINLPKNSTQKQIKELFKDFHIQEIVFTYKVKQYHRCMNRIATLKKKLRSLHNQLSSQKKQTQQIKTFEQRLEQTKNQLQNILKNIKNKKKRLSIAFIVFQTIGQRNLALKKYKCGIISKLFYKTFPRCSKSAIKNQHVTIESAPAPDDIQWQNLENPYLRTKAIRLSSFIICVTILIFGLVSEVFIFSFQTNQQPSSARQIFSSLVVFVINFFIINFLQYTTKNTEAHISNTNIKLSLIRKITFFMFINLSISPFLIMVYNRIGKQVQINNLLQSISLTILVISIGNFFKPLLSLFSIQRFTKWYKCRKQIIKGVNSQLNQLQANQLFEPMQFPIQIFYSLLNASIMMSFFYLGCFQIIIVIQLPALLLMYLVAKWMLIKICKHPRGLSLKLNNLSQSLMRFYVPLYWIGGNIIPIINAQKNITVLDIIQKIVYQNPYQIVSLVIVIFMLFCQKFIAIIASKLVHKKSSELSDYYEIADHNRTYSQANMFFQIHQEGLQRITVRLRKSNKAKDDQQSEQSIQVPQKY